MGDYGTHAWPATHLVDFFLEIRRLSRQCVRLFISDILLPHIPKLYRVDTALTLHVCILNRPSPPIY